MKEVKIILGLFIVTLFTSILNIKADSYLAFSNITLTAFSGIYTSSQVWKNTTSQQYMKETNAIDNVTGGQRAVSARIKDATNSWTGLVKGTKVQLDPGTSLIGTATGNHRIQLKATKSTLAATSFWGTWYLDN